MRTGRELRRFHFRKHRVELQGAPFEGRGMCRELMGMQNFVPKWSGLKLAQAPSTEFRQGFKNLVRWDGLAKKTVEA